MNGKALTDGEWKELVGMIVEGVPCRDNLDAEVIRAHLGAKGISHQALEMLLGLEPKRAVTLLSASEGEVEVVTTIPDNHSGLLLEVFEHQARRLIAIEAFKQVRVGEDKYWDELMTETKQFVWQSELAAIGLDKVALVDYRLSGEFLAKAGDVYCCLNPDKCSNYRGVVTPIDRPMVIQGQWGPKYRHRAPCWCRRHFDPKEQGLIVKEALTVFLYEGESLLDGCFVDITGSVSERSRGQVPFFFWSSGGPRIVDDWDGRVSLCYGSASRGR